MEYRELGNSSCKASVLGLGALHFGVFLDRGETSRVVRQALDRGINFIDTAPMYRRGQSEAFIRQAIAGRRQEVLIATKVGLEPKMGGDGTFGVSVVKLDEKRIRTSLEESLRNLGTEYIDLYQVHAFDRSTPPEETLSVLDRLVQEGKVRFIGCSNYNPGELVTMAETGAKRGGSRFISLQNHYNLIERRSEGEILPLCRSLNLGMICNRALCRGILSGKYKLHHPPPAGSRAATSHRVKRLLAESTVLLAERLDEFARNHGHTLAEMAIAWLLAKREVSIVLAGVRNGDQLDSCIRATEWRLSPAALQEIDGMVEEMGLFPRVRAMPETYLEV
jgi:aryl-alcohol dehydrogenase-like predicted oxidoreductase